MNIQTAEREMPGYIPVVQIYPSDPVCRALVSGLEWPVESPRRGILKRAIDQLWGRWAAGILFLIVAMASLITLWYSNGALDWMLYWVFAGGALLLQMILLGVAWYVQRQQRVAPGGIYAPGQISIRTLLRGALAGDDGIAPAISIPVSAHAESQPDVVAATFRVVPPESRFLRGQQIMSAVSLALGAVIAAMWALVLLMPRILSIPNFWPWQMFALVALPPFINGLRFVAITRKVRAIQVEARADGLHWGRQKLP